MTVHKPAAAAASAPPAPIRKARPSKYPFATMAIGECFFVEGKMHNDFYSYASMWGTRLGRTFSTRLCTMRQVDGVWTPCDEDAEGATLGVGVWRGADRP